MRLRTPSYPNIGPPRIWNRRMSGSSRVRPALHPNADPRPPDTSGAEIGHDALVDLASEETFQAPDDLSLGSAVRRAACDVINGRLMVPHADDDGSIEGGVGVSVAASIEAVPAGALST